MKRRKVVTATLVAALFPELLWPVGALAQNKRENLGRPEFSTDAKTKTEVNLPFMKQLMTYHISQHQELARREYFFTSGHRDKFFRFVNFLREPHYPPDIKIVSAAGHKAISDIYNCLKNYYVESFFLNQYFFLINQFVRLHMAERYNKLDKNREWMKSYAKDWMNHFRELENRYIQARKYVKDEYEKRLAMLRKDPFMFQGKKTDEGKLYIYLSNVFEDNQLYRFFGLRQLNPAFQNRLDVLDLYIYECRDELIESFEKDLAMIEGFYKSTKSSYDLVSKRVTTDKVHFYEEFLPIIKADAEILKFVEEYLEESKKLIADYKKGGQFYQLTHNEPSVCPEAFREGVNIRSNGRPVYRRQVRIAMNSLEAYIKPYNNKLDQHW